MNPDDAVDLTVRNQRPQRWTAAIIWSSVCCFWAGACGVGLFGFLHRIPIETALLVPPLVIVSCVVFGAALALQPVRHWKLGDALAVMPGRGFIPENIRQMAFAPDPAEDYVEKSDPVRLCEVRALLRPRGSVRLIVSVGDAIRVRAWADRHAIEVSDPSRVLVGFTPTDHTGSVTHRDP